MKKLRNGQPYAGRPADSIPMSFSFDRDTARMLDALHPSKKGRSEYVARLIHAESVRLEERHKLSQMLTPLLRQFERGPSEQEECYSR
jgi:hypothetical protein